MFSEWPVMRLEECVAFQEGYVNPSQRNSDYFDGPVKWLRALDLNDSVVTETSRTLSKKGFQSAGKSALLFKPGSLAISKSGTIGRLGILEDYMCGNRAVINIRVDQDKCDTHYLFFVLKSRRAEIESLATGSVQKNLYTSVLGSMELILPPLPVQRAISEQLWTLDKKIQLNHQINQTLEQMAQAMFKSWFVEFEPVKAKIAALKAGGSEEDALFAAMEAISGKDAATLVHLQTEHPDQYNELRSTAELFPSAMQDSELGDIPLEWSISQIGDEVTVVGGGTPSTKNPAFWDNGEFHWTTPKDLSNIADKVLIRTDRTITKAGLSKISSGLLPVDTVIMSSRAPVGYLALTKIPVAINQGYIALKCSGTLSPEYVIQWATSVMDDIQQRASGTTFAEISKRNFKIIPVILPSPNLMETFSRNVSSYYSRIELNLKNSNCLSNLRDSLLPRLLSGELEI